MRGAVILGAPASAHFSNPNLGYGSSCAKDRGGSKVEDLEGLPQKTLGGPPKMSFSFKYIILPQLCPVHILNTPQSKPWWNVLGLFMTRGPTCWQDLILRYGTNLKHTYFAPR